MNLAPLNLMFIDHRRSRVVYNFGPVCLSVCQTITFESLDVGSSYLYTQHTSTDYGSSSYMKVIGGQGQGHSSQQGRKLLFPQCKTSIGKNSRCMFDSLMFACSMGFSGTPLVSCIAMMVWSMLCQTYTKRCLSSSTLCTRDIHSLLDDAPSYSQLD